MYKHIKKDNNLRVYFNRIEFLRVIYLFLSYNRIFNLNFQFRSRIIFLKFFHEFLRRSSISKIHNFCFYTGRARGVYRFYHLSRLCVREFASKGSLIGLKKASW